jgi:hypothetical protein
MEEAAKEFAKELAALLNPDASQPEGAPQQTAQQESGTDERRGELESLRKTVKRLRIAVMRARSTMEHAT